MVADRKTDIAGGALRARFSGLSTRPSSMFAISSPALLFLRVETLSGAMQRAALTASAVASVPRAAVLPRPIGYPNASAGKFLEEHCRLIVVDLGALGKLGSSPQLHFLEPQPQRQTVAIRLPPGHTPE